MDFGVLVFWRVVFCGATLLSSMAWGDDVVHGSVPSCIGLVAILLIGFSACAATSAVDNIIVSEDLVVKTDGDMRYCEVDGQLVQIHSYDRSNDGFVLQKYESVGLGVTFGERVRIMHNGNQVWVMDKE